MTQVVRGGALVRLEYELATTDGVLIEDAAGGESIEIVVGQGDVPGEVEAALEGAPVGARLEVELDGQALFGPYDPALLMAVPAEEIPGEPPVRGDWVPVELEDDESPDGGVTQLEWRVVEVDSESIILDGNHPGAGKSLVARLHVLAVDEGP